MSEQEMFSTLPDGLGPASSVDEYVSRAVAIALQQAAALMLENVMRSKEPQNAHEHE